MPETQKGNSYPFNMDVFGVSMPPYEDFSGTNVEIMHLDTVFNLVHEKKALTVPYLFEKEYAQNNPIVNLLESIDQGIKHETKTGEVDDLKIKLVDYMRSLGYEIIWVGGDKGDLRDDKYLADSWGGPHCLTMPLLRRY